MLRYAPSPAKCVLSAMTVSAGEGGGEGKDMSNLLKFRARKLRKNNTDAENHLWYFLRSRQMKRFKFRRQHIIAQYLVDFVCLSKKLIIELDGGQHAERKNYDGVRTQCLESQGYKVLRFWNEAVFKETETVLESIYSELVD